MAKKYLVIFGLTMLLAAGYFAKRKFYDPAHRLAVATEEVKALESENKLQDGDIIFQTSMSAQSKAIQLATKSEYSHCGIIFKTDSGFVVFEAVQPVKYTPLSNWIARGKDQHYIIKRLKNSKVILTPEALTKMKEIARRFSGKSYDIYFDWSDDKIYCSELVWKLYRRSTGIQVGNLQQLREFDLNSEVVKQKMKDRYGNNIPLDDTVISPVSILKSPVLYTVKMN
jgi:hypothetical protein